MKFSEKYHGEILSFLNLTLYAFFPVFGKLALGHLSPLFIAAGATLFATLFFTVLVSVQGKWNDFKRSDAWPDLILGSLIIGVLYYGILYSALQFTSAGNAAIVATSEIAFTFLFFRIWKKEKQPKKVVFGASLLMLGALIVLFPGTLHFYKGDLLILLAGMISPLGNFYQQNARRKVSAAFVMFVRSLISTIFLFGLAFLWEGVPEFSAIRDSFWILVLNGVLVFGLAKVLYIESIFYISVSKAIAMQALAPGLTLLFAAWFLNETPFLWQMLGLFPIFIGAYFLIKNETD